MVPIATYHAPLSGHSGAKGPACSRIPPWDLAMILQVLCKPPFEYLEEVPGRLLTIKTVFLLAISSLKRVSDLQALSMAHLDLEFAPGMAKAFLYPRPGYIPKVSVVCEHWMDHFFFICLLWSS